MIVEVPLLAEGITIEDAEFDQVVSENFPNVLVAGSGRRVIITIFVDDSSTVDSVVEFARKMSSLLPRLKLVRVDRDLVGVTEIAHRVGVTREGARKWTQAENFPLAYARLTSNSSEVWAWGEVSDWLKEHRSIEMDEDLPSAAEMTQIDNCLAGNPDATTVQWHMVTPRPKKAITGAVVSTRYQSVPRNAGGRAQSFPTGEVVGAPAHGMQKEVA